MRGLADVCLPPSARLSSTLRLRPEGARRTSPSSTAIIHNYTTHFTTLSMPFSAGQTFLSGKAQPDLSCLAELSNHAPDHSDGQHDVARRFLPGNLFTEPPDRDGRTSPEHK